MRAMLFDEPGRPLRLAELPAPSPGPGQLLLRVTACAVCRTDLHVVDGDLPAAKRPVVPGHEIVGTVVAAGRGTTPAGAGAPGELVPGEGPRRGGSAPAGRAPAPPVPGARVGVPWLGWTCGACAACRSGRENLCADARFTGYQLDGGFAEYALADARYCFPIPAGYPDLQAAPLLCAGLIGWRSLVAAGEALRLGLYGFGAAAHIVVQVARWQGRRCFAFTKDGDAEGQAFARELGAVWVGGSGEAPPEPLDAAIIFAPVGPLVPAALRAVRPGGTVVCAGIHMTDIPAFPYAILWGERTVRSVANLTRRDGEEFLAVAPRVPVRTEVRAYPLERANEALDDLRAGRVRGAAVLTMAASAR